MARRYSNLLTKSLSYFVLFALTIQSVPVPALAATSSGTQAQERQELPWLRTANSSQYRNPNGSFTVEIYDHPVHWKKDGQWVDIDNTLVSAGADAPAGFENGLSNKSSRLRVDFKKTSGNGSLLRVSDGQHAVSFAPMDAQPATASARGNRVDYPAVYPGADLHYSVSGEQVKESISLQRNTGKSTFSFSLQSDGVQPELQPDGSVAFESAAGAVVFSIPAPIVTDANGKTDPSAHYTLDGQGNTLSVVVDSTWLGDSSRAFPVTIDPTVTYQPEAASGRDTFAASGFPDNTYYMYETLRAGPYGTYQNTRSYLWFQLPSLLSGATITSATLDAYQTGLLGGSGTNTVGVYQVTQDWSSPSLTWNNQPAIDPAVLGSVSNQNNNVWQSWDISDLVAAWYNGSTPNYGVSLRLTNDGSGTGERSFPSSDYVADATKHPKLTINYTINPSGHERFWTEADDVNVYSGHLLWDGNDFAVPGRGFPLAFGRTYDSGRAATSGDMGYGWTNILDMHLSAADKSPVMLVDGDGSTHHFAYDPATAPTYTTPSGLFGTLVQNADGTYTYTRKDQSQFVFDTSGRLWQLIDTNDNTTTLSYGANGQITSITDASGRAVYPSYDAAGRIIVLNYPGRDVGTYGALTFAYNAAGDLVQKQILSTPDGNGNRSVLQTVAYDYDANHRLTSVTDPNGVTTTIAYNANGRVESISRPLTQNGVTNTATTNFAYDLTNQVTTVTDPEGRPVAYTWDDYARTTQVAIDPTGANYRTTTTWNDDTYQIGSVLDANGNQSPGSNSGYAYDYDTRGNLTKATDPLNQSSTFTYEPSTNNLLTATDPNGVQNQYYYDLSNNNRDVVGNGADKPSSLTAATVFDAYGNPTAHSSTLSVDNNTLNNHSFERDDNSDGWPDAWDFQMYGSANFSWTTPGLTGNRAVTIANASTEAGIGANSAMTYDPAESYTASAFVKTSGVATPSAWVEIAFYDAGGALLSGGTFKSRLSADTDWARLVVAVPPAEVPQNAAQLRVFVGTAATSGSVTFDALQLEQGAATSEPGGATHILSAYNMVEDPSFEQNARYPWTSQGLSAGDTVDNTPADVWSGSNAFKIQGATGVNKAVVQHINDSGPRGQKLTLSGWSLARGADPSASTDNWQLVIGINNTDGTTSWFSSPGFSADAKMDGKWQHGLAAIVAPNPYNSIDLYVKYYNQSGTAWFDDVRLQRGSVVTQTQYDANGNYAVANTDPLGDTTTFANDNVGNLTQFIDAETNTTQYAYDDLNRLTGVTDASQHQAAYDYDDNGNLIGVTDPRSNKTSYAYNQYGEPVGITDPLSRTLNFGYDKSGNKTAISYPNGNVTSFAYDDANRLVGVTYNNEPTAWTFGYDPNGNRTSVTDATDPANQKTTAFTYDALNRLTRVTEAGGDHVDYAYDAASDLTSTSMTAGSSTTKTCFTYDGQYRLNELADDCDGATPQITRYVFNENGEPAQILHENGTATAYTYDGGGRLTWIADNDSTSNLLSKIGYTYDANGNVTSMVTLNGEIDYAYDSLNRLTSESDGSTGRTTAYAYDPAGNRTEVKITDASDAVISDTTYAYDAANELTSRDADGTLTSYSYDANGNLVGDGHFTYAYNGDDELVQVKQGSTVVADYSYGADGLRTSKTTSSGTTTYHYDGRQVAYETDGNNAVLRRYVRGPSGDLIAMVYGGTRYTYHFDARGDVVAITDPQGQTAAWYNYDAWGNIIASGGTTGGDTTIRDANPYRFVGKHGVRFDEASGTYLMGARVYNPTIARFITQDIQAGQLNRPQTLNHYAYALDNPTNLIDPAGTWAIAVPIFRLALGWNPFAALLGALIIVAAAEMQSNDIERGSGSIDKNPPSQGETTVPKVDEPSIAYPGDDPATAPEGYVWKGKGQQGSKRGSYVNEETGEKLRADLDHVIDEKKGIKGPHWDYTGPAKSNDKDLGLKLQWRLYPDGTNQLKEKSRRLLDKYTLKF